MVKIGSLVAFNRLPDAVWFEVLEINGFRLTVREHGTNNAPILTDKSLVRQIRDK